MLQILGTTLSTTRAQPSTRSRPVFKKHSFYYIPLIKNLAAILSNDQLKEALLHSNCKRTDGKFEFIQDGVVLSNHPLFKIDPHTLELILYSDEIEICNAVGTRAKKHKLLMFYYLLSNLPRKYRSVVDAINLYAVVRSEDVSTYGFDVILQPLLDDLKKLGIPTGNLIPLRDGSTIPVRASLVAHVADNPAVHQAIGLKESVGGSFRKCRFCHADFEAMQNGFSEDDFEPRSLKKHLYQCDVIHNCPHALKDHYKTAYGINRKSILTEFPHFDMIQQTPPDVMHILLEGVIPLTLQALTKHYINIKQTSLAAINNNIKNFCYDYMEANDKPNFIRDTDLHGSGSLNQDAAKSYLLFRIFPFVVGNGVDQTDRHWELYTLLSDITEFSFSAVVSLDTVARLKDIVKEYLELFKQLFPDQPFTPKQHYLVHFPKVILLLGPLINFWAMRFEAKHQYFKGLKKLMNFKNICLSLSRHHQKVAAMNRSRNSIFKENENGPIQLPLGAELLRIKERVSSALAVDIRTINSVVSFKWIKLHGTKYIVDECYLAVKFDDEDQPQFGKLSGIFELSLHLIVFDVIFLETLGFDNALHAFEVRPQAAGLVSVTPDMLVIHTPLPVYKYNGSSYIKIKGSISDLKGTC